MHRALLAACGILATTLAAEIPKNPAYLTKDAKVDRKLTYNLGATGMRGWIYTRAENFFEGQQGRTTTANHAAYLLNWLSGMKDVRGGAVPRRGGPPTAAQSRKPNMNIIPTLLTTLLLAPPAALHAAD